MIINLRKMNQKDYIIVNLEMIKNIVLISIKNLEMI